MWSGLSYSLWSCYCVTVWVLLKLLCTYTVTCIATVFICLISLILINNYILGYILAYKLLIMSIYTYNWESVMDLDNKMLNIEEKKSINENKNENRQKTFFFIKKTLFIEMKNQKIKNTFFFNTRWRILYIFRHKMYFSEKWILM